MSYQVGNLQCIDRGDPTFEHYHDAIRSALAWETEESWDPGETIGVWTSQEEGSELVAIIYQGQVFESREHTVRT